jgi:hypothetical protein
LLRAIWVYFLLAALAGMVILGDVRMTRADSLPLTIVLANADRPSNSISADGALGGLDIA